MNSLQRATAHLLLLCFSLLAFGCSGPARTSQANLPPIDDTRGRTSTTEQPPTTEKKFLTKKNMVLLAGAAALYYMYRKHQNSTAASSGPESQYYLSKNGRVYYRDSSGRAHWVTPPREGIAVPADEAASYQQFQGYNNSARGRDLVGL